MIKSMDTKVIINKPCHCDPMCEFCKQMKGVDLTFQRGYCSELQEEVDADYCCKRFVCPDCGRTHESFVKE